MPKSPPTLPAAARAAAAEILAAHAGSAHLADMLALAYMRGNVDGFREADAVLRTTSLAPARAAA